MATFRVLIIFTIAILTFVFVIGYYGRSDNNSYEVIWSSNAEFDTKTQPEPKIGLQLESVINLPEWYRKKDWELTLNESYNGLKVKTKGLDKEEQTGWDEFFYGTTKGLMLEMGAMNGKDFSVSYFFEKQANWRTILIEGNPTLASQLSINRPNSLNFNLVICGTPSYVHYMAGRGGGLDGIMEFMSKGFAKQYYKKYLLPDGEFNWTIVEMDSIVQKVQCLPLLDALTPLEIDHINFFLLDVEGGELNILKAIDFERITFDVICVETDRMMDNPAVTKEYVDAVIELLTSKGYILWTRKLGRNSWFVSPDYEPSKKPA